MLFPELSPDERSVALQAEENQDVDIWIHEVGREAKFRLTTGEENEFRPLWSGDGLHLVFSSIGGTIFRIRSDGAGEPREIFRSDGPSQISDASPDLNTLVVQIDKERRGFDLWQLKRNGDQYEASPIVETEFIEPAGKLSPDGRFIAYCSDRSGDYEVYVQPLEGDGRRVQVSFEGGTQPRWSADGKELFYVARQDTLVAVKVSTNPTFQMGEANELFSNNNLYLSGSGRYPSYDVSNDGQRFLLLEPADQASRPEIHVIQNWQKAFGL
jgi:Tol biopolymer transport system component